MPITANPAMTCHRRLRAPRCIGYRLGGEIASLNDNAVADEVVGGWQLSATTTICSWPAVFTVYADGDTFGLASGSGSVPQTGIPESAPSRHIEASISGSIPPPLRKPANGTLGNVRRNSLYGPGFQLGSTSRLARHYNLVGKPETPVRADAANAINHTSPRSSRNSRRSYAHLVQRSRNCLLRSNSPNSA